MGNTWSTPGVAEFPVEDIVRDGVIVGEIIGTFWREDTLDGWRWRLLGSRERFIPDHEEAAPRDSPTDAEHSDAGSDRLAS